MRVISGKFKGKKISFTNSSTTRPLRDYVKENIFNILTHGKNIKFNLDNCNILDYGGAGLVVADGTLVSDEIIIS